jgi:NAD(P)H dehydrogenase (quinone)
VSIVVTGATGQLGRLVIEALLERGYPATDIVGTGRDTSKIDDLAERGVQVVRVDYAESKSLREAFSGAERILLISGSEVGQRVVQHQNVIEAAKEAGVELLVYTSIAHADRTLMQLAAEHQATEKALADSGLPYALLRNGWYLENYTGQVAGYLEHGAVLGSAGNGRISAATRADYAQAAAAVLLREDQAGSIYELGGDDAFTLAELAVVVSEVSGRPVTYRDLPTDQYTEVLVQAGLPESYAAVLADSDQGISRGDLQVDTGDLSALIGRPTRSMPDAVREAAAYAG